MGRFHKLHEFMPNVQIDGRRTEASTYKKVLKAILAQLGDDPTLVQQEAAKRLAGLALVGQRYEANLINGDKVNQAEYLRFQNTFGRAVRDLGLVPRSERDDDDGLTLEDFLEYEDS